MVIRDAAGNIVPFGKVHKRLVADFLNGTLPEWVEVVGTPTFEPLPDRGTITVTTPGTAGASVELRMKQLIDSSKVTAIAITFEALQFNGNIGLSVQIGIKSPDSKAGITFFQNVNQKYGTIRAYKADGTYTDFQQNMVFFTTNGVAGDEAQNRKNITVLLCTGLQFSAGFERPSVWLGADDQYGGVAANLSGGLFQHGNLQCLLKLTTSPAEAKYFKCSQMKVDIWSN
ncbi:hypothetical protein P9222_00910 [Paenibacillus amylolyticus]|nr:hypothetical protein [Paenibacillus amylolyticus]WFR63042.1 hypothetical protein P9222_00910 [Paenibacillus amylolyticus]